MIGWEMLKQLCFGFTHKENFGDYRHMEMWGVDTSTLAAYVTSR